MSFGVIRLLQTMQAEMRTCEFMFVSVSVPAKGEEESHDRLCKPARKLTRAEIDARDLARRIIEGIESGRTLDRIEGSAMSWLAWISTW